MNFWIGVLLGSIACIVYRWIANMIFTDGTLMIDTSNPEKDVYRFVVNDLKFKKKRIILKVDRHANLSQNKHPLL